MPREGDTSTTLTLKEVRDQAMKNTLSKMEIRQLGFYCKMITPAAESEQLMGEERTEGGKPGSHLASSVALSSGGGLFPPTALMLLSLKGGGVSLCSSPLFPHHSLASLKSLTFEPRIIRLHHLFLMSLSPNSVTTCGF